jgi:hypothetical protein
VGDRRRAQQARSSPVTTLPVYELPGVNLKAEADVATVVTAASSAGFARSGD